MNHEADEKLRQAVRDWLEASPAASACLIVDEPDGGPPVFLLVGTAEQIRAHVPDYRRLDEHLRVALLEHDAGGVALNTWGDIRRTVGKLDAERLK